MAAFSLLEWGLVPLALTLLVPVSAAEDGDGFALTDQAAVVLIAASFHSSAEGGKSQEH
jgi:hypothetical protein